jgi:hypothetical protein
MNASRVVAGRIDEGGTHSVSLLAGQRLFDGLAAADGIASEVDVISPQRYAT